MCSRRHWLLCTRLLRWLCWQHFADHEPTVRYDLPTNERTTMVSSLSFIQSSFIPSLNSFLFSYEPSPILGLLHRVEFESSQKNCAWVDDERCLQLSRLYYRSRRQHYCSLLSRLFLGLPPVHCCCCCCCEIYSYREPSLWISAVGVPTNQRHCKLGTNCQKNATPSKFQSRRRRRRLFGDCRDKQ